MWSGLDASKPEVVFFFEGQVWESGRLPKGSQQTLSSERQLYKRPRSPFHSR
jgi:hypothetical protein